MVPVEHSLGGHAEPADWSRAEGSGTSEAARRLGVSRQTVVKWRDRFAEPIAATLGLSASG